MTPTNSSVEAVVAATKPRPYTKPTMSSHVLAIRQLTGEARRRAEAAFLKKSEGFVARAASWYIGDDLSREEVMAAAGLGFAEALADWDPARGMFHVHVKWRMRGAMAKLLRSSRLIRGCDRHAVQQLDDADIGEEAVEADAELSASEARREVAAALAAMPAEAAELIRAELRGDVVTDKKMLRALSAAKELLGELALRRRRGVAAPTPTPTPSDPGGGHGDSGGRLSKNTPGKP